MPIDYLNGGGGGGSPGPTSTEQMGSAAIGNGASSVDVTFPNPFTTAPVWVLVTVGVPQGSASITATVVKESVTLTGFTATLSAATDNANYVIYWEADESPPT